MILLKGGIVTLVVSLHRRGMRAEGALDYGGDQKSGNDGAVGVAGDDLARNDFFAGDDDVLGGAHTLDHDAEVAPAVRVALFIGALHVHDGEIGLDGADGVELLLWLK